MGISRGVMKKSLEFPWVLGFDHDISKECHTISRISSFSGISKVKVTNLKIPVGFSRKV